MPKRVGREVKKLIILCECGEKFSASDYADIEEHFCPTCGKAIKVR